MKHIHTMNRYALLSKCNAQQPYFLNRALIVEKICAEVVKPYYFFFLVVLNSM